MGNELLFDSLLPLLGSAVPKEVEINEGDKVVVDFDIDTGIR
jgi:hypothetical protein